MRMAITIDFDVDLAAWGDEYGERGPDIKPAVAERLRELIAHSAPANLGIIRETRIRRVVLPRGDQ